MPEPPRSPPEGLAAPIPLRFRPPLWPAESVRHVCLIETRPGQSRHARSPDALQIAEPGCPTLLERARWLSDLERLVLVLQGTALLHHLRRAGWRLTLGWRDAVLGDGPTLRVRCCPGWDERRPGERLVELGVLLFGLAENHEGLESGGCTSDGPQLLARALEGRGEARRRARWLFERWQPALGRVDPRLAVEELLDLEPRLFDDRFRSLHDCLAAELRWPGRPAVVSLAVPPEAARRWRRRASSGRTDGPCSESRVEYRDLVGTILDDPNVPWWSPRDGGARESLRQGRIRSAVRSFRRAGVRSEEERLLFVRGLYRLGRFREALEEGRDLRGPEFRWLALACRQQLGEQRAARRELRRLEEELGLPADLRELRSTEGWLDFADVALRIHANADERERLEEWIRELERLGRAGCPDALGVAALGAWDLDRPEWMEQLVQSWDEAGSDGSDAGRARVLQARGLLASRLGRGPEAAAWLRRAVAAGRRARFGRAETGRLWNDLTLARVAAGDLWGAERSARHADLLLAGCDGPLRRTLSLPNLAEVLLRRGKTEGLEEILATARRRNRRDDNRRAVHEDTALEARYRVAVGDLEKALALCERELLEMTGEAPWQRDLLLALGARALAWMGLPDEAVGWLERGGERALGELEPEERVLLWALVGRDDRAARVLARDSGSMIASLRARLERLVDRGDASDDGLAVWDWSEGSRRLGGFRTARLVYDLHRLGRSLPPSVLRVAAGHLETAGASRLGRELLAAAGRDGLAELTAAFDAWSSEPWWRPEALSALFASAGFPRIEVRWRVRDDATIRLWAPDAATGEVEIGPCGVSGAVRVSIDDDGDRTAVLRMLGWLLQARAEREGEPLPEDLAPELTAKVEQGVTRPRAAGDSGPRFVGRSAALLRVLERVDLLALRDVPVLVLGESGTGKELIARRVHARSVRSEGPFVAVNCATLVGETVALSELFGHARGAFTGADRARPGLFESADRGVLFLDEIAELPLQAQAMLLRVLQEGELRRLGESRDRRVDVRLVAATLVDLEGAVSRGAFRRDLFHRLAIARIELPPLRDRGDDVIALADDYLSRHGATLAEDARAALRRHPWPGNVRELFGVLEVGLALCAADPDRVIRVEHLDLGGADPDVAAGSGMSIEPFDYHAQVREFRRQLVRRALEECDGRAAAAARRLGLSRQTLSYLVRSLDVDPG